MDIFSHIAYIKEEYVYICILSQKNIHNQSAPHPQKRMDAVGSDRGKREIAELTIEIDN